MEKIYKGVIYIIMTVIIIFNAYDRLKKIKEEKENVKIYLLLPISLVTIVIFIVIIPDLIKGNLPMHIIFILCYLFIITMTEIIGYFIQKDKINN